jgi:hypothetical protein
MADVAGVAAATAKGAVTLSVSGVDASGAVLAGDTFEIAGHTRRYTVTANATATTGTVPLNIFPELQIATVGSEVVTFHKLAGQRSMNSAFHRNFAALATAPLSRLGAELGAKIGVAYSDEAGLALRTRLYYNGDDSEGTCCTVAPCSMSRWPRGSTPRRNSGVRCSSSLRDTSGSGLHRSQRSGGGQRRSLSPIAFFFHLECRRHEHTADVCAKVWPRGHDQRGR